MLSYCFSVAENHEVFVNVDLWYVPCNYSIVNAPVVMAKFVEGQSCLLDTTVNVEGKRKRRRTRLS